ncbi:MAG: hypothetical protein EPO32_02090 [Anaerolineae bacterium]|nr:MAG: hypothetical protein EPO32_02090 [Anaerolineae bacterium]
MSAIPDVVTLKFGVLGGFAIPQTICAACGHAMLSPAKTVKASAGSRKQNLSLDFPLCQPCSDLLAELEAVEGRRAGRGCLVSLPFGVLGYFAYHLVAGRSEISWLLLLVSWLVFFLLVYHLFGQIISPAAMTEEAEAVAERVRSAVKITGFTAAHSWADGGVTLEFIDHTYAHAFLNANATKTLA